MLVRALAYMLAYGPGIRQATEDAVLNANYIRKHLEGVFDLPYNSALHARSRFQRREPEKNGVNTMDIAKRLIDYGFHPYTTAFPLIVPGALMIEPTESESQAKSAISSSTPCARSPKKPPQIPNLSKPRRTPRASAALMKSAPPASLSCVGSHSLHAQKLQINPRRVSALYSFAF